MSERPPIDLRDSDWEAVRVILSRLVPEREVWAFGSRVRGTASRYSDLDLVILGDQPLGFETSGALAEAFAESDLPFKVDVVEWSTTGPRFREVIQQEKVVVRRGG